jgi:hypothetical protein
MRNTLPPLIDHSQPGCPASLDWFATPRPRFDFERVMSTPHLQFVAVLDGQRCRGHVLARGKTGFEAFDTADISRGLHNTPHEAATALSRARLGALARFEHARKVIAETVAVDVVLEIRDSAWDLARLAKDRTLIINAMEIQVRAERRLGELIKAQKETVGLATGGEHGGRTKIDGSRAAPSNARPTLADAGIDKKLSSRAQKLASLPGEDFEVRMATWRASAEQSAECLTAKVLYGTFDPRMAFRGEIEWQTPGPYIELARAVLGGIDLDPASSAAAQERVKATTIFTQQDDGLTQR